MGRLGFRPRHRAELAGSQGRCRPMIYNRGMDWHLDVMIPRSKRREIIQLVHRRFEKRRPMAKERGREEGGAAKRFSDLPFAEAAELF
jgi:hypothetical protein